ncbi:hypothetical protein M9Y10_033087 [Tritrichomonas musculus]|uniref:Uncharacterized protein n=1 Tax=Tritrichomonas musculus TaxID=1915356 RepID=A0ABR2GYZ2_9EUKA
MKKRPIMLRDGGEIEIDNDESPKYFKMAANKKGYDSPSKYGGLSLIMKPRDEAALKESLQCFQTAIEK